MAVKRSWVMRFCFIILLQLQLPWHWILSSPLAKKDDFLKLNVDTKMLINFMIKIEELSLFFNILMKLLLIYSPFRDLGFLLLVPHLPSEFLKLWPRAQEKSTDLNYLPPLDSIDLHYHFINHDNCRSLPFSNVIICYDNFSNTNNWIIYLSAND